MDVLVDGVRGSAVPVVALAHLRRHRNDVLVLQQRRKLPGFPEVLKQGLALELSQHIDRIDA